jgi:small basic protein (TIGR04137 family)
MTIDKSLRVKAGAISNRNVLTRAERILKLKESERWKDGDRVLGLPKVRVLKLSLKKKKKAAKAEEEGGDKAAAPAGGAAKPAAGAAAKGGAKK